MREDTGMERFAVSERRLTAEEFLQIPEDGKRHELVDGVHYVTPSPNLPHQVLVGRLHLSLGTFLEQRAEVGRIFLGPLDVVLSDRDVVEPDLLFVAADQTGILTQKNVQGPPALAIEVLSPSTKRWDERVKRRLFDDHGVREYWLVDPVERRVRVLRRASDGSLPEVATLDAVPGARLETPLLPGWSLVVVDLFQP
jgi:Uma2 family endonuclease